MESLRPYDVFFSSPLDFDLIMLKAFPDAYEAVIPDGGGPKMAVDKAAAAVLGTEGPGLALYDGEVRLVSRSSPSLPLPLSDAQ